MPSSNLEGKKEIKEWFRVNLEIESVVDIGPGLGTYYYLLKDHYPNMKFIAIEIYQPYVQNFMLRNFYDEVIIGDFTKVDLPPADCVILGDVLEHVSKNEAIKAFKKINVFYKHVVLSIPWGTSRGGPALGNPYEEHKSFWTFDEVSKLVGDEFKIKLNFSSLGVFIK